MRHLRIGLVLATALLVACGDDESAPKVCAGDVTACASDTDCGGFRCAQGCCTQERACSSTANCPEGEICIGNLCQLPSQGRCAVKEDCTDAALPYCDTTLDACVRCITDFHCNVNGSEQCVDGACVLRPGACATDAACLDAPDGKTRCDTEAGACVECTRDNHCLSGNKCELGRCVRPNTTCTTNASCAGATPICDTSTATCVACVDTAQCPAGNKCEDHQCVPVGCALDADCAGNPASPRCKVSTRTCVACLVGTDCEANETCTNNACVELPGCSGDAVCAAADATRPYCITATRTCVACRQNVDCGSGRQCVQNACQNVTPTGCTSDASCAGTPGAPRCNTTSGACVACLAGADCPSGRCDTTTGACLAGCAADSNCAAPTPKCDPGTNACVACLAPTDCAAGNVCRNRACVPGCTSNANCAAPTPKCQTATQLCVACLADGDCGPGNRCTSNQCVPIVSGGDDEPCGADGFCTSDDAICIESESGTGVCRKFCDPYASACATGKACAWIGYDAQLDPQPLGVCVPRNGRGAPGVACQTGADCEEDLLCLPSGIGQRTCAKLCDPAGPAGACTAGNTCHDLPAFYDEDLEETLFIGTCLAGTSTFGESCLSDYTTNGAGGFRPDCGAGMTCAPGPLVADPSLVLSYCQFPAGVFAPFEGEADVTCTTGATCKTGDCLGGPQVCNTSCRWTSDCTRADLGTNRTFVCMPYLWVAESPYTGELNFSETGACQPTCRSDAACGTGRHCRLTTSFENSGAYQSSFQSACYWNLGDEAGPNKRAGQPCTTDGECASGTCVTNGRAGARDGYCFGSCDSSASQAATQCDSAKGVVCDAKGFGLQLNDGRDGIPGTNDDAYGRAIICGGKSCANDAACTGLSADSTKPRSCQLQLQVNGANSEYGNTETTLRTTCEPSVGTRKGGAACSNDSDCASGACFLFESGRRACFGACVRDSDCDTSRSTCETAVFGDTEIELDACVPN